MLFGETISVALSALRANKLRSVLTMLGIVIGVAAVIAMIALGTGAQAAVKDRIAALGTTLLTINPGQQRGFGVAIADAQAKLTMDDAKALDERATSLLAVQPEMNRSLQVQWGNKNANTSIVGTSANYLEVRKYALHSGRMFTSAEDEGRQRVAVIGPTVATNMGLDTPDALLGENIRIRGIQFAVVGILESKGQATPFGNPDDQILIPITTARFREIGVRKALGATRRNILLQFLIEAVVLCCMGGVVGILFGAAGATVMSRTAGWNTQVSPAAVGLAFAFSALVGVLFGVWPARRAAALDPIIALRYE